LQRNVSDLGDTISLEKRIAVLEAKVEELSNKINQLLELVKALQTQPKDNSASTQNIKQEETDLVYITKSGEKYHKPGCRYLIGEVRAVTIETAERMKLQPCKICFPEKDKEIHKQ